MKQFLSALIVLLCALCVGAESPAPSKPLFTTSITCFVGPPDSAVSVIGSLSIDSNDLKCESGGKKYEIHWDYLGSERKS